MKISEVIIVEGKHDVDKLKEIVEADFIITNGSEISRSTLKMIEEVSKRREIIIFTDPDFQGERIRRIVSQVAPNAKHAFIEKTKAQGKRNLGVEFASRADIIESLGNLKQREVNQKLTWGEYLSIGITQHKSAKLLRNEISNKLNLGVVNNKQLFNRLNMFGYTKEEVIDVVNTIKKDFNL